MRSPEVIEGTFDYLVFDLGGVLVKFSGEDSLMQWTGLKREALWHAWLRSETVRAFEKGETSPEEFAERIVAEFKLPLAPTAFLTAFATWPRTLYPGTYSFLRSISTRAPLACLSNTNPMHWPYIRDQLGLGSYFDQALISYETGYLKPDPGAFENLIHSLACTPDRIAFFDDNEINTRGARKLGITAYTVHGLEALQAILAEWLPGD